VNIKAKELLESKKELKDLLSSQKFNTSNISNDKNDYVKDNSQIIDNKTMKINSSFSNNLISKSNTNSSNNSNFNSLNTINETEIQKHKESKETHRYSQKKETKSIQNKKSSNFKMDIFNILHENKEYESKSFEASQKQKAFLMEKCHPIEISDREERKNINLFEIDPKNSYYDKDKNRYFLKINPLYAVKAYTRSAADVKMDNPEFLRPPRILFDTVKYLIDNIVDIDNQSNQIINNLIDPKSNRMELNKYKNKICNEGSNEDQITNSKLNNKYFQYPNEKYTFKDICLFVEDRFRAIRQDYIILATKFSVECIQSHEIIARFLILSLNECLDYKAFSGSQGLFKLLIQQLNATLTSLREFYFFVEKNFSDEKVLQILNKNKDEFISYSILLSVTSNFDLVSMMNMISNDIKNSPLIKYVFKIVRCILSRDVICFFKLLKNNKTFSKDKNITNINFDYLITCIMSLYLKDMRKAAFDFISSKQERKSFNYLNNIKYILDLLAFENFKEFYDFLNWYGIKFPDEIREYIKFLNINELNAENNFSRKSRSISGGEGSIESDCVSTDQKYDNLGVRLENETFEEIKNIFDNYDNKDFFFGNGGGANSRFVNMEFYMESYTKDESDLYRITNKRFIEEKKNKRTRKEILIEK